MHSERNVKKGWQTCSGHLQVRIDGINIKELDLRWLRQQMALVSQEPALFTARTPTTLHVHCIP